MLIEANASVNMGDLRHFRTPLILSCIWGHRDVVNLLLKANAGLNQGELLFACSWEHVGIDHDLLHARASQRIQWIHSKAFNHLYVQVERTLEIRE